MAATIFAEGRQRDIRLAQYFNSTRDQWIDVVKSMVAARGRCTADSPKASPGYLAWDAGITRMRQLFVREGWERGDDDGIENIFNADFRRKVTVVSCDDGVADPFRSPRNRTQKGGANEKVIDLNNQLDLFRLEHPRERVNGYDLWQLCVLDDGTTVRAELSRPVQFSAGYFVAYSERIWILGPGEWEKVAVAGEGESSQQEHEVVVRRKK